jgi:hypothetical protein
MREGADEGGIHSRAQRGYQDADRRKCVVAFARMISDLDIWRAANLVIRQHGADAEIIAAQRTDLMLERADRDGAGSGIEMPRQDFIKLS